MLVNTISALGIRFWTLIEVSSWFLRMSSMVFENFEPILKIWLVGETVLQVAYRKEAM